jgi:D-alanine-D-alanine ligase
MKKYRIGVIYGGRSGEHEVSLASAAAVVANLDRDRYEPIAIWIEKDGRWTLADRLPVASSAAEVIEHARLQGARPVRAGRETYLIAHPSDDTLITIDRGITQSAPDREAAYVTGLGLDVIFPVLHGPYGEDGTVQGLLELANVPYVGAGVLASATGMDKPIAKVLFAARGLPVVDHLVVTHRDWQTGRDRIAASVGTRLGYPVFVKPANLGSSVGITKVKTEASLADAIERAGQFDRRVLVEAAVPHAREIECAVLGNDDPQTSVPGEIIPSREFYDYEAKYLDDTSKVVIPAPISPAQTAEVQRLAIAAFQAIDGAGMARVDFLLNAATGALYVNEINTIPGFTTISMYSKMWQASGLEYPALLDRLIELAIERHAEKQRLKTSVL